jgi:hypothetical protein
MRPRSSPSRVLAAVCLAASTAAAGVSLLAASPVSADNKDPLFVYYTAKSDCLIYPNYPKPGVKGQLLAWTVEAGNSVIWRYNVNDTWALVSDPHRAKEKFPWWGFTEVKCLGNSKGQAEYPAGVPVPTRIREGRSHVAASGWRPVDYDQGPEPITRAAVRVKNNATLRDRVNFVVGNVFAEWKVDVTGLTRSNGHWTYVYSPSARKWGYIETRKLDL